ncbi:hypothetical protein AB6T38_18860 [Aliiglaciecola sp. SL4]|uniref:hypothetical protein n=1 Tax=Aliiglaciecola sp. SL4 TaxID=3239806 RepID=UPI00355C813D
MQPKCPIKRRSIRLLHAVHELHKQGYQNLAGYFYMSASGFHWRLELKNFHQLYINKKGEIEHFNIARFEQANHSSGDSGNSYFGWEDAKTASARELAELIKSRFPRLIEACHGQNFEYAGWFTYMLGFAEQQALPKFFADYSVPIPDKIHTTDNQVTITAPPHQALKTVNGINFLWAQAPNIERDWHTAYRPLIDSINKSEISQYPQYPIHSNETIEHGAYWEGAIYFLSSVMRYKSEVDYIRDRIQTTSRWKEFEAIFNSEGQLHLFDAHMARVALKDNPDKLTAHVKQTCEESLRDIQLMYQRTPYKYPNPYFGGNNPLHLTALSDCC